MRINLLKNICIKLCCNKNMFKQTFLFFVVSLMLLLNFQTFGENEKYIYPVRTGEWAKSLNGVWKFKYIPSLNTADDSLFYRKDFNVENWDSILVPGNWDIQGYGQYFDAPTEETITDALKNDYKGQYTYNSVRKCTGLYRTEFTIPASWKNRQTYILFDGVLYTARVYVNGKYVGYWASAYNPVTFDITKYLSDDEDNVLAVEVTSNGKGFEFDINDQWAFYGIFRNVTLFSTPQTHINDYVFKTTLDENDNANVSVSANVDIKGSLKSVKLNGALISDSNEIVKEFSILLQKKGNEISGKVDFLIENPKLWTAETPNLYTLKLTLIDSGKEEQIITDRVGLREVTIKDGQLLLNKTPIKLRGIDIHQISPDVGRYCPDEYLLRDFNILKKANINFVRTSHYPPPPRFTEICDSMGFYVMEEVPFGFGDIHLTDTSYQNVLYTRAFATYKRDKNRPGIIVWSIGNENPVTEITINTAKYMKQLDPTRPVCFPQTGSYFSDNYKLIPDFVDIYSPHYTSPGVLEKFSTMFNKPIIVTEYAHSLGLDFDMMQNVWEVMYKSKIVAGGGVWDFADQGILRRSKTPVDRNLPTNHVWIDKFHFYDANSYSGSDGIVYSNRIPQPDYYEVKNVYSPVHVNIDKCEVAPGMQNITVPIENRYDFTNLSEIKAVYGLYNNNYLIKEYNLALNIPPHSIKDVNLKLELPDKFSNGYYLLKFNFYDKDGLHIKEETVRLMPKNSSTDWITVLTDIKQSFDKTDTDKELSVKTNASVFEFNKTNGSIKLSSTKINTDLITGGMFLRTGRKSTLSSRISLESRKDNPNYLWVPYTLKNPEVLSKEIFSGKDSVKIVERLRFKREDVEGEYVEGTLVYVVKNNGWIDVEYNFTPVNCTGVFLEAGVSFVIPKEFSQMRWIGDGPYPSYPDKDMLDEFGIYQMSNEDLYFQGNRRRVETALFTNKIGNGLMVVTKGDDIAVENISEGILVSHNALVSSRYNKKTRPLHAVKADETEAIAGKFSLRVIEENDWKGLLHDVFGNPLDNVEPFKPFYHSYDQ